jgi:TRAP-type transport system periplasmic protein
MKSICAIGNLYVRDDILQRARAERKNGFFKIFLILFVFANTLTRAAQGQTILNLASGYSDLSFQTKNLRLFAQDVERQTSGALTIRVHSNSSLVALPEIPSAVGSGRVQIGEYLLSSTSAAIPLAVADSLPFLIRTSADAMKLWTAQRKFIEPKLAEKGMVVLYASPWPMQGLYSIAPVRTKLDLAGLPMRTYNPMTIQIAQMLGALPVDVPMVKVNEALATGKMTSMISSSITGVENKVWSHLKHFYPIRAWMPKNMVVMNNEALSKLSIEERSALLQAAARAEARGWEMSEDADRAALQELRLKGVSISDVSPTLDIQLAAIGDTISREWVRKSGVEGMRLFTEYFTEERGIVSAPGKAR